MDLDAEAQRQNCIICFCFVVAAAVDVDDADDVDVVDDDDVDDDDDDDDNYDYDVAVDDDDDDDAVVFDDDAVVVVVVIDLDAVIVVLLAKKFQLLAQPKRLLGPSRKVLRKVLRKAVTLWQMSSCLGKRNRQSCLFFIKNQQKCRYAFHLPILVFLRQAAPGETSPRRRRETGRTSTQSTTRGTLTRGWKN